MPGGMGPHGPRGGAPTEKADDLGGALKDLMRFRRRYIPAIILALVLGVVGTVCQIIGPEYLGDMTDEITKGLPAMINGDPVLGAIDMAAVTRIGWTLVALYVAYALCSYVQSWMMATVTQRTAQRLYVAYALCSYVQSWMMATVTQRTAQRLRSAIDVKMNKLPLKYFDEHSNGDVMSRITNDVDAVGQTLGQSLGSLITSVTLFFGALIMMFANNGLLALCAIAASLLGMVLMLVVMRFSQRYFVKQQAALGDVNGLVEEMYSGHTVVKAFGGEADASRRFERYNNDLYESGWKSQFLSGLMMPMMNLVGNLGYVVVCVVGAWLAMSGRIEFGVIVAFMLYIRFFTQPLSQFAQAFQNLQRCAAGAERVFTFLNEPELADESSKQPSRRSAARRTRSAGSSATTTTCTSRGGRASSFPA